VKPNLLLSLTFVFIQFLCLALIALTGPWFPANPVLLAIELLGIALGAWAVLVQGIGNFNITPDPVRGARLVTSGPYSLIRHPMYTGLLLVTLPLLINAFTLPRLLLWLVLLADLLLKLNYEEGLLAAALPGYAEYQKQSYRILPFIY
jgi:protein-S-isoprenylcysteine O-methyltransferase Ste14